MLLVTHLVDMDEAKLRLDDFETRFFKRVNDEVTNWAGRVGWASDFRYLEGYAWVAPENWRKSGRTFHLYFRVEYDPTNDPENAFDLTDLCGVVRRTLSFQLVSDTASTKQRTEAAAGLPGVRALLARSWPFQVGYPQLVAAVESGDYTKLFDPIRASLDQMLAASKLLEPLVTVLAKRAKKGAR